MRIVTLGEPPDAQDVKRECGECRLCCKVLSIDEEGEGDENGRYAFHKRPGKWCEHAKPGGCAIYHDASKPISCANFLCAWLEGFGDEEDRPDKNKVVITAEKSEDWGNLVIVYESYPGIVQKSRRVQALIEALWVQPDVDGIAIIPSPTMPRRLIHKRKGIQHAIPLTEQFTEAELTADRDEMIPK